jgi:hypothetical protein
MANLTYRVNSSPTLPGSTSVKNSPLTNTEVDANFKALDLEIASKANGADITAAIATKQNVLVSGTNIKSVNGATILGSGDLEIVGGLKPTAVKTANYTAVINDLVRADSSAGAFNVTLPSAPADGDKVGIFDITDSCGANYVTVLTAGGKTVEGDSTSLIINMPGAYVVLSYNSFDTNWKILSTPLINTNDLKTVNGMSLAGSGNVSINPLLTAVLVSSTSATAAAGNHYFLSNVAATTVTLPAAPQFGDAVAITPINGLITNVVNRNGNTIMGLAENLTINNSIVTAFLRFVNNDWRLV